MAQTGYTPILIYSSSTASNAPSASNLTNSTLGSELAINIADGKLFYKDSGGLVQVIGWKVVPATAGGTGQTSYAVGDLLYADTTTSLAKLADIATGNALISGGVGVAPSWGKIGLTTHVSGTLPIANGGTNATSFNAPVSSINGLVWYDGTGFANDATTSHVGYNSTTNTFYANTAIVTNSVTASSFIPSNSTIPTNGLYLPAANSVGLATNSTNAIYIDSSQNVTVGTSGVTAAKFNVSSSSIPLYVYQSGTTALQTYSNVAGFRLTSYQSTAGSPYTKTTDFVASGDGTVGSQIRIFTTAAGGSPAQVMHIFGSSGVSIGNTTDPGATNLSVTGYTSSASFRPTSSTVPTNGMYLPATNAVGIATNSTERIHIASTGIISVNSASTVASSLFGVAFDGSGFNGFGLNDTASASGTGYIYFQTGGTTIGSITRVAATSAVAYNTVSDKRLKTNIEDAAPVLNKLMDVKVRQYDWIDGDLHQDAGFIAQELEPLLSGVVTKGKTEEDMWQLDYSKLTPYLLKAIQEQQVIIEQLKQKIGL